MANVVALSDYLETVFVHFLHCSINFMHVNVIQLLFVFVRQLRRRLVIIWLISMIRIKLVNFGNFDFTAINWLLSIGGGLDITPLMSKSHLGTLVCLGAAS